MTMSSGPASSLAAVPVHFQSGLAEARPIIIPGNGGADLAYSFAADQFVQLQAISVDVDTSGAGGSVAVEVALADPSGVRIAAVRTGAGLDPGLVGQVTFAANLPDSSTFPAPALVQQIQAALWEATLPEQALLTVAALDAGALITEMRVFTYALGQPTGRVPFAGYARTAVVT